MVALNENLASSEDSQEWDEGETRGKVEKHAKTDRDRKRWQRLLINSQQENGGVHSLLTYNVQVNIKGWVSGLVLVFVVTEARK